jgi:hypothetical protein
VWKLVEENAMPWSIEWLDQEESVLIVTPSEPWGWGEMEESFEAGRALVEDKPYEVDFIIHFTGEIRPPASPTGEHIAPFIPLRDQLMNAPQNRGLTVLVAAPLYVESIVRQLQSVVKGQIDTSHFRFAKTISEAEQLIKEARAARGQA